MEEWRQTVCKPAASADGAPLRATGVDANTFARVIRTLEKFEEQLRRLGRASLLACFNASRKAADKDWTFCRMFFERKYDECSPEQKQILEEWRRKICQPAVSADGAPLRATDREMLEKI